jgi:hypothetical protein
MPRRRRVQATVVERVKGDSMPTEMEESVAKEEETVTMGISEYDFLRKELSDLRFELANQR